jgi:hypothetical protein
MGAVGTITMAAPVALNLLLIATEATAAAATTGQEMPMPARSATAGMQILSSHPLLQAALQTHHHLLLLLVVLGQDQVKGLPQPWQQPRQQQL